MHLTSLFKVILLLSIFCIIYVKPNQSKYDVLEKFINTRTYTQILNVNLWTNNKIMRIIPMYYRKNWRKSLKNTRHVTDLMIKALCCVYSNKLNEFIMAIDLALNNCEEVFNLNEKKSVNDGIKSFNSCTSAIKNMFYSNKEIINDMFLKLINFSKVFDSKMDVNFYNALMSINTYLFNDNVYGPISIVNSQSKSMVSRMIEKMRRSNVQILKKLEGFSIVSCDPPIFDEDQTRNKIEQYCDVKKDLLDKVSCLGEYVSQNIYSNLKIIPLLSLDLVTPNSKFYEPQNLMLSSLLDLEITIKNQSTSIRNLLTINWEGQEKKIDEVSLILSNECRSESVIQHQLLMIDCIVSVVFYLISSIVSIKDEKQINTDNCLPMEQIIKSLDILNELNFQEPLNSIFKGISYSKSFYSKSEQINILDLLNMHFEKSNIGTEKLRNLLRNIHQPNLLDTLNDFIKKIMDKKENIIISIDVIKKLTDYNTQECGFYQIIPINNEKSNVKELENYRNLNCDFALTLKKHFLWINIILEGCEVYINNSREDDYVSYDLVHCFNLLSQSVQSMSQKAHYLFSEILNFDRGLNFKTPINKNIIDSVYSFILLLNNKDYIAINDMNQFRQVGYAFRRINILRRYHHLIINFTEKFSADYCDLENSQSKILQDIESNVKESCFNKIQWKYIDCINKLMLKNTKLDESFKKTRKIMSDRYRLNNQDSSNKLISDSQNAKKKFLSFSNNENINIEYILRHFQEKNKRYITTDLKTLWIDGVRPIQDIQELMKNYGEPKYLLKNHLLAVKSIVFVTYEKMKNILIDVKKQAVRIKQDRIDLWSNVFSSLNLPRNLYIRFNTIFKLFGDIMIHNCYNNELTDELINIIKCEQSRMRITNKSNIVYINIIRRRMGDMSEEEETSWNLDSNIEESEEIWYDIHEQFNTDDYYTYSDTDSDNEYALYMIESIRLMDIHHKKVNVVLDRLNMIFAILDSNQIFN